MLKCMLNVCCKATSLGDDLKLGGNYRQLSGLQCLDLHVVFVPIFISKMVFLIPVDL